MGAVESRESFFEAGLDVLAELGYGGLKLAEVCDRLGVTTGSFYHYFANWPAYTHQLVSHWGEGMTSEIVDSVQAETDPRLRIDRLVEAAVSLPHSAEAAIRVWSALDPHVRSVQESVDRQRFEVVYDAAFEVLQHPRQAELFAAWAVYVLVGYEQTILPPDAAGLRWIIEQLRLTLDAGLFTSVPDRE
ncbi:TetR/AcrR family transcriptional regulator [Mycobacterium sp. ITM-2016-00317]|uniref:TetR/AcrR family transcriptional regulator n=1 Tax=Mycobacterium sp. ITM-2016-00317 TaxID=2099694 RepID=UPI00287FB9E2|nr:TetR/AcrR family transcriptional regulator [Mycobacterium sp. ITM-2016-00317]WNG87853.1 TetR/AcrR family transcriptional regulator [Mycobacterium sp. ITM-2016-00317]